MYLLVDATQIEINPFAQIKDGRVYCIDAKLIFDDNAAFRQKNIFELDTCEEMSQNEILAKRFGLSYIPMDGNIACMVNGAGLAMATMDIIKLYGGVPANFLDVGGSATVEQVSNAFKIVASSNDQKIKAIFVNIFAGILRCDIIAEGVIAACNELESNIPVVLRFLF
uniref:ATP-citrate lyase/succinyl-CoA ligase domain-containing protein n=1 Tax=Meloidogyne incognita TaxID=6306 RepID=A0A914KZF4_MELIC